MPVAVAAVLAVMLSSCVRSATPANHLHAQDVYADAPPLADVQAILGGSGWWPGPPSFQVRPLNIETIPTQLQFSVTTRYVNVGTTDRFELMTQLWDSTSSATGHMSAVQSVLGTPATGPRVGDQTLYYELQPGQGESAFTTLDFIRVGQSVAALSWILAGGVASSSQVGKMASRVTGQLRDLLAGRVHGQLLPESDLAVLPPVGPDITLIGSARLPIQVFPLILNAAAPQQVVGTFQSLGVTDFVYGDYVLNNDTQSEVRASVITFLTSQDASNLFDAFRGTNALDANGTWVYYDDVSGPGQYYVMFAAGTKLALLNCRSTTQTLAASRSCENPQARVALAWIESLRT